MASRYQHVTQTQRYTIEKMLQARMTQRAIARAIGVSTTTMSREVKRNSGLRGYRHKQAQRLADARQQYRRKPRTFTPSMRKRIEEKLKLQWSPEQIVGDCTVHAIACVSIQRIYQHVWNNKRDGGLLHAHLRCGHRKRRKRYGVKNTRGLIPDRRPISTRPAIVDSRKRFGDWEADTMIGKQHKQALVTIVERKSRLTRIGHVARKTAAQVSKACIDLLRPDRQHVRTITTDNGKEFASHQTIEKRLAAKVYFADPYASWQRGTNENTNGLIRQYVPKSRPLNTLTNHEIQFIEDRLNNRPRKCLGFKTPNQVFSNHKRRVALRS